MVNNEYRDRVVRNVASDKHHKAEQTSTKKPPLTQQVVDQILSRLPENGGVKFKDISEANGFTCDFDHVVLRANWSDNLSVDFSGCDFHDSVLKGNISNALFSGTISNTLIDDAHITHTMFANTLFEDSAIIQSDINYSVIKDSDFSNTWLLKDHINFTSIHNNTGENLVLMDVDFPKGEAGKISVHDNELHSVKFVEMPALSEIDGEVMPVSQVNIGLIAYSDWYVPAKEAIEQLGQTYTNIDPMDLMSLSTKLDNAVLACLESYKEFGHLTGQSFGQYLLSQENDSILQVKQFAQQTIAQVDGLWIPGDAADIHPELYGQTQSWQTKTSETFVKEVMEFALIDEALSQGKPIIGVCHGAQIVNVFWGGDIKQNVWWQTGSPPLTIESNEGILGEAIKDGVLGHSRHSQAVKTLSDNLELVASYNEIPKAMQARDGRIVMLTQFHPEYLEDQSNINIVQNFLSAAQQSKALKTALAVGDILEMPTDLLDNLVVHYRNGAFELAPGEGIEKRDKSITETERDQFSPEVIASPVEIPVSPGMDNSFTDEVQLTCSDAFWS